MSYVSCSRCHSLFRVEGGESGWCNCGAKVEADGTTRTHDPDDAYADAR